MLRSHKTLRSWSIVCIESLQFKTYFEVASPAGTARIYSKLYNQEEENLEVFFLRTQRSNINFDKKLNV